MNVGQRAEWERAATVLVCEPRGEALLGSLQANAANWLRPFDLERGRAEHAGLRSALEAAGVHLLDLRDALAFGTTDDPDALARLRRWGLEATRHELAFDASPGELEAIEHRRAEAVEALDAGSLAELLLLRPTVTLERNDAALDSTSAFNARFELRPATNAYFTRDPLVTTARGVVVGRERLAVRRAENEIAARALEQLGVEPLYRVEPPGCLEGGDFLPCGDFALQGRGLLTDQTGIDQLLARGAYGEVEVAVVADPHPRMDEMHLDTYLALLGPGLAAICEDRTEELEPVAEIWEPDEGSYRHVGDQPLGAYLAGKGLELITFTKDEQRSFAGNGLLVAPGDYIAVEDAGERYLRRLEAAGVRVTAIPYRELTGGYGGPHCSTQVLAREPLR